MTTKISTGARDRVIAGIEILRAIGRAVEAVAREVSSSGRIDLYLRGRSRYHQEIGDHINLSLAPDDGAAEVGDTKPHEISGRVKTLPICEASEWKPLGHARTPDCRDVAAAGPYYSFGVLLALGRLGRPLACGCDPWARWQHLVGHRPRSARWAYLRDTCPSFAAARGLREISEMEEKLAALQKQRLLLGKRIRTLTKYLAEARRFQSRTRTRA